MTLPQELRALLLPVGVTSIAREDLFEDAAKEIERLQAQVNELTLFKSRHTYNHERDCGLTNDVGLCECPQTVGEHYE